MKVVQMLPELESGGVERGTVELARHLAEHGHQSLVISGGGRMTAELEAAGSRHLELPVGRKSPRSLTLVPRLRRLLAEQRPDILHLRSRVPAWLGWLAWRAMDRDARPALVTSVHGFYSVNRWSAVMTRGQRVICVSESVRRYVLDNYPATPADRLRVVHRGIDPAAYPHGHRPPAAWRAAFEREFPATAGKRLVTLPGRITRLKGHHDLLGILPQLPDPQVQALVVGAIHPKRRGYLAELEGAIAAAGLAGRITFTGPRTDLREILAISDVVLSLSRQPESFGRTTLEALGLGRPVVGYDHGGVAEQLAVLLPQGRVPPGDTRAAAGAIRRFLDRPPAVPAAHPFTLQAMLEGTVAVYHELVADQPHPAGD
jgi:glycosyltransferase involved in cell wall biosynthesis